jgi:cell division protein FtsN
MRNSVPYGLKFISRFFLEIVPAVLAAVIGGFLFAHYYTGSPSPEQSAIAVSAIPSDGRAALVDEEHAQLVDFLKQVRAAAKPGDAAAGPAAPAKPRSVVTKEAATKESVVKVRRAPLPLVAEGQPKPQPAVVATSGPLLSAQPGSVASNPVPPADIPNVSPQAMAAPKVSPETAASGRAPADDKQAGVFGTVLSKASEIKDQAIDFVRDIPGRVLPPRDKTSDATVPGAPQRLSQTSPE